MKKLLPMWSTVWLALLLVIIASTITNTHVLVLLSALIGICFALITLKNASKQMVNNVNLLVMEKPEHWRDGQTIVNFMVWMKDTKKFHTIEVADIFQMEDKDYKKFYNEYINTIK